MGCCWMWWNDSFSSPCLLNHSVPFTHPRHNGGVRAMDIEAALFAAFTFRANVKGGLRMIFWSHSAANISLCVRDRLKIYPGECTDWTVLEKIFAECVARGVGSK